MKWKVALPFRHQAQLVCDEARRMLIDEGFELVCNETGQKLTDTEQKSMISDAYAVIAGTERYDSEMLSGCVNLRVVMRFGVGTDNFDLVTMRKMNVEVGVIANHDAVAEFTLTLILSALKNLPRCDEAVRAGKWSRFPMRELKGKTVGIVGFGRIGRRLAELLKGFDVSILAYDPYINVIEAEERGVMSVSFKTLLTRADIVSLHLPYCPSNRHMIDSEAIAQMKDGAYLINTARGPLVDEVALVQALESGKLSGAGIDVYETEPITKDNPLMRLGNTALAPHCAALSYENNYNGGIICAESIIRVRNGEKPIYPVFR